MKSFQEIIFLLQKFWSDQGCAILQPLDLDTIYTSVKKTGKCIILQEDTLFGGISSDISALIMENCFEYLDAPVRRVGSLESAIPFMKSLEDQYLPKVRFEEELKALLAY
jgi:2-oxoisovalerate dehydrogenase E1 component